MKTLVDIVIPVYGRPDLLQQCLDSINTSKLVGREWRVQLVNDQSPDDSDLRAIFRAWPTYHLKRHSGFPTAVNKGVKQGNAPLVLLLNSDVILQPDTIDNMVKELDNPAIGVVGPMLVFPDESRWGNPGKVQHAGLAFDISGKPFHIHLGWAPNHPRLAQNRIMQAVTGACLLTRRSLWDAIGGMNPDYGIGTFEDVEYCFEIRKRGLNVLWISNARATHYTGQSATAANIQYPLSANNEMFLRKWKPLWDEHKYW